MTSPGMPGSERAGSTVIERGTKWAELSDEELALHCSTELADCMDELLRRYDGTIRDCARRMAMDPDQAEDAAQEIFLRLVTSLPRYEGRSAFATWLYRLAHNTCIDSFRRDVRRARVRADRRAETEGGEDFMDRLPAEWGEPDEELDQRIQECYLAWVVSQLPPDYRQVIRLRLVEGRSTEEVAATLGATPDAVKGKLKRARQRLRTELATPRACPYCSDLGSFRAGAAGGLT